MAIPQGGVHNITVIKGATYSRTFEVRENDGETPIPLNGYVAAAQIRDRPEGEELYATFNTAVDGPNGRVTITLPASVTAALDFRRAHYDVFVISLDETAMIVQGEVALDRSVTVT